MRTSAGSTDLSTSRWKITSSTNDANSDAEGRVPGKAVTYQCNMLGVNLSQLRWDTPQSNWFMNVFDHDAVDVCTVQARASANGVSQFNSARTTRYFTRNKTGCYFTRHDRRTKLYIIPHRRVAVSHFATLTVERQGELTKSCIIATLPLFSLLLTRKQDIHIKIYFIPPQKNISGILLSFQTGFLNRVEIREMVLRLEHL